MDEFTPQALLGVVNKKARISTFFLDMFFPNMYTFGTAEVSLDVIDDAVNAAIFVSPEVNGEVIKTRGFETRTLEPASLKPKHEVNVAKVLKRRPGESVTGSLSLTQRRQAIIVQNMIDEEKAIAQTEEWMASQAVLFGKYTCEGVKFPRMNVDFGRSPENNITLQGGAMWTGKDKLTFNPMADIEAACVNAESGINIMAFDSKGWSEFIAFKAILDKLETRRGSNSQLETALKDLGKDVSYKGYLGDVLCVVYTGYRYVDGVKEYFMPDYTVVLGHSDYQGARLYGAILDDDAIEAGMQTTDRYPKVYKQTGDVSRTFTMIKSAPLMATPNPDQFVVIKFG